MKNITATTITITTVFFNILTTIVILTLSIRLERH